ncbi:hypothetical protein [Pectinatus sottacetonis]|uniref:hypothetical protein n=1 Tax=Pectinatus sottacetonis TaxID=1002795 RepID=UPI0018C5823F|nr:hypothetical protein [Pectinatus sottacetonis]
MSVNPIGNLQAMLPNSSEVGKMQNKMTQQVNAAQNFGNEKLQQESEQKQLQVQAKDEVEDNKIRNDGQKDAQSRNELFNKKKPKHQTADDDTEDKLSDAIRGHNIDIKL